MKKYFIDVENEIRKYFFIYIFIAYVVFLGFYLFRDFNLMEFYMNTIDSHFYNLDKDLNKSYNSLIQDEKVTKNQIFDITENYYEVKQLLNQNLHIFKYYFPGFAIIGILIIAYIHVAFLIMHLNKKNKLLKATKLSKIYPSVALILMFCLTIINNENYYIIKIMENVNLIMSFILITFGVVVSISLIDTLTNKFKNTFMAINILTILVFPTAFWLLGVWGSLFNVKIIKKVDGK